MCSLTRCASIILCFFPSSLQPSSDPSSFTRSSVPSSPVFNCPAIYLVFSLLHSAHFSSCALPSFSASDPMFSSILCALILCSTTLCSLIPWVHFPTLCSQRCDVLECALPIHASYLSCIYSSFSLPHATCSLALSFFDYSILCSHHFCSVSSLILCSPFAALADSRLSPMLSSPITA